MFPDAEKHLYDFYKILKSAEALNGDGASDENIDASFNKAMDDDFNTALAISNLYGYFKKIKKAIAEDKVLAGNMLAQIQKTYALLGLFKNPLAGEEDSGVPSEIVELADKLTEARAVKDYATADAIRAQINEAGYNVSITKDGIKLDKRV